MFTDKYGRVFVFVRLPQVGLLPNSHMKAAVEAVNTLEKKKDHRIILVQTAE